MPCPARLAAASASYARRASSSASGHRPRRRKISARCARHSPRYGTRPGCASHQSFNASVHSCARRMSSISKHAEITLQYTTPETIGVTSPAVTATITSSKSATPSATRPSPTSTRPRPWRARLVRSASAKRSPMRSAAAKVASAPARSPHGDLLERLRQHHVSALDAVVPILLEQTPGACRPAGGACELARANQRKGDPERGPRRLPRVASLQRDVVRTRVDVDAAGLMTGEIRGDAQPFEVRRLERRLAGRAPRAPRTPPSSLGVAEPARLRARSLIRAVMWLVSAEWYSRHRRIP